MWPVLKGKVRIPLLLSAAGRVQRAQSWAEVTERGAEDESCDTKILRCLGKKQLSVQHWNLPVRLWNFHPRRSWELDWQLSPSELSHLWHSLPLEPPALSELPGCAGRARYPAQGLPHPQQLHSISTSSISLMESPPQKVPCQQREAAEPFRAPSAGVP